MKKTFIISIIGCISLLGCGKETYTSDYLFENDEIRAKVLEDCKANKQSQDNCTAANEAESKKKVKELQERRRGGR